MITIRIDSDDLAHIILDAASQEPFCSKMEIRTDGHRLILTMYDINYTSLMPEANFATKMMLKAAPKDAAISLAGCLQPGSNHILDANYEFNSGGAMMNTAVAVAGPMILRRVFRRWPDAILHLDTTSFSVDLSRLEEPMPRLCSSWKVCRFQMPADDCAIVIHLQSACSNLY
jgi:hypothetical protein